MRSSCSRSSGVSASPKSSASNTCLISISDSLPGNGFGARASCRRHRGPECGSSAHRDRPERANDLRIVRASWYDPLSQRMAPSPSLIEKYRRILQADPRSRIFVELARQLLEASEPERAADVCERGLEHHPSSLQ